MEMINPLTLGVLVVAITLPMDELPAAPQVSDAATARVDKAKKNQALEIDLPLIRRAVEGGLLSAREGKQALQFDQLRREKKAGTLSEQQAAERLKELGTTWAEGAALLKKLAPAATILQNGDFESGKAVSADNWSASSSHPPSRSKEESHDGRFSMHSKLTNEGAVPCEGLLRTKVPVDGGETYRMQFWIKPVAVGPSYVTQYHLQWLDPKGRAMDGTGFVHFTGRQARWTKIEVPKLVAPEKTKIASLTFRFVTGAVKGGHGEMYIDGVTLYPTSAANTGTDRQ